MHLYVTLWAFNELYNWLISAFNYHIYFKLFSFSSTNNPFSTSSLINCCVYAFKHIMQSWSGGYFSMYKKYNWSAIIFVFLPLSNKTIFHTVQVSNYSYIFISGSFHFICSHHHYLPVRLFVLHSSASICIEPPFNSHDPPAFLQFLGAAEHECVTAQPCLFLVWLTQAFSLLMRLDCCK